VGQAAALTARAGGLSVALGERELVGGESSYWGCVPSKALLRPVLAVADARRVDGARHAVTGAIDPAGVFGRRDRYVTHWHDEEQTAAVDLRRQLLGKLLMFQFSCHVGRASGDVGRRDGDRPRCR
jgi:pyruvate/2-oxoglutarate dehydrogenase complex dihydrolipoamide dehydrogenase (E3) component